MISRGDEDLLIDKPPQSALDLALNALTVFLLVLSCVILALGLETDGLIRDARKAITAVPAQVTAIQAAIAAIKSQCGGE